jgi:Ribbon-helix-helix protein, copG family
MENERTISIKLPESLYKDLTKRAKGNERTLSQEVRLALKLYMAKAGGRK